MLSTLLVLVLLFFSLTTSLPNDTVAQYFNGLDLALANSGAISFVNALNVHENTVARTPLLGALDSNASFTIYAPVDSVSIRRVGKDIDNLLQAWGSVNPIFINDLVSLLSYHVCPLSGRGSSET